VEDAQAAWEVATSDRPLSPEIKVYAESRGVSRVLDRITAGWVTREDALPTTVRIGSPRIIVPIRSLRTGEVMAIQARYAGRSVRTRKILGAGATTGGAMLSAGAVAALAHQSSLNGGIMVEGLMDFLSAVAVFGEDAIVIGCPGAGMAHGIATQLPLSQGDVLTVVEDRPRLRPPRAPFLYVFPS
jgi:hypothetical protein